ncbi:response regulator transcription factor [Elusimicrobiota bacterium]
MTQVTFWIVSADSARGRQWETVLAREGWPVTVLGSFEALLADAADKRFGIALVDWDVMRLRLADGLKKLKSASTGISMILTSDPGLSADKLISVLEAGADDHFLNTIDDRLLVAKLKAHLRRLLPSLAAVLDVLKSPSGEIKLDRSEQQAWLKGTRGRWVPVSGLTRTEFQFLALFLEQPGKVLERHFIMENVWKGGDYADIRPGTVDKHIESLRRKLGRFSGMIRTVYGVGYVLQDAK